MAGRNTRFWRLIAALALCVALAHWLGLSWLAQELQTSSVLRPMAKPLFTRVLTVAAPVRRAAPAKPLAAKLAPPAAAAAPTPDAAKEATSSAAPAPADSAGQLVQAVAVPSAATESAAPGALGEAAASAADAGAGWPSNTRLSYVVGGYYRGDLHGNAHVQWQREGERYQVQLEVSLGWLAQFTMTSQGLVTPGRLMPEVFEEEIGAARRNVRFTPQDLLFMNGVRQPRPEGVQDTASQFVELTHRFASATEPLSVGQSVTFWMARPGGADEWTYDVLELETLSTPRHGALPAFHLKPRPLAHPRGPITAELWFAPTLQYLPVRIKINLGEQTWIDLLVETIEQGENAPSP